MKLSILTPTFNPRIEWLVKAVESVKAQTFTDYELVLVNDGSQKVTSEAIQGAASVLGDKVRYHNLEANVGFNKAVNFALNEARGEYAMVLGDDDYLVDPTFLAEAITLLDSSATAQCLLGDYILRREDLDHEETIRHFPGREAFLQDGVDLFWEKFWLPIKPAIGWGSFLFRTATARQLGGFVAPVGDMRLVTGLLLAGQLAYLPKVGSCYRYHQGNTSSRGNVDMLRESLLNVTRIAEEGFQKACAVRPLPEVEARRRHAIMVDKCRQHAASSLRYFRSLGRVTLAQAVELYPLVFSARTPGSVARSSANFAALLLPPAWMRTLKAAVVGVRRK